jgi:hypothetical protein
MTSGPHKVRVKIGDAEFEAEGSEETVREQYSSFLAALPAAAQASTKAKGADQSTPDQDAASRDNSPEDASWGALLARAFKDEDGIVSLRLHPKGDNRDADALLMIIYGYHALKQVREVPTTHLGRSAAQTGLGLDRIDRVMAKNEPYCMKGGERKGTYYALNNPGTKRAKELLTANFQ